MHHRTNGLGRVHREHRRAGHGQAAGFGVGGQHPAVVRRGEAGETLRHTGLGLPGAGSGHTGLRCFELGLRSVQRSLGHEALGAQVARALKVGLGVSQVGIGFGKASLRLRHTSLGGAVVDHGQHLAGLHPVAGFHRQAGNAAAGLGRQHALAHGL